MRRSTVLSLSLSVSVPLLDSKNTLAYQSKEMYNINSQSGVSVLKLLIDASFIIQPMSNIYGQARILFEWTPL